MSDDIRTTGFGEGERDPRMPPLDPPGQQVAPAARQDVMVSDFGDEAGAGLEGTRLTEQVTPFLRMLQSNSPQLDPASPEYIKGATQGMICNTATGEVWPGETGVDIMICAKDYHYGLWIPRDKGSGYRGNVPPEDPMIEETLARMTKKYGGSARFKFPRFRDGMWTDPAPKTRDTAEEVEAVETGQLFALYAAPGALDADMAQRAIVAFTSTSLPAYNGYVTRHMQWKYRQLNGLMLPPPLYAYRWNLSTVGTSNAKGKFYVWKVTLRPEGARPIEALLKPTDPLYLAGREFYQLYTAGRVKPDYDGASPTPGDDPPPF